MSDALAAWASVDPEELQRRLAQLEHSEARAWAAAVVDSVFRCLRFLHELNLSALERRASRQTARELWAEVEHAMATVWMATEDLRGTMQPLAAEYEAARPAPGGDGLDVENLEGDPEGSATSRRAPSTPLERILETAWAMTFILSGEVEGFRARLPALLETENGWEMIGALQEHASHISSTANAIVTGIFSSLPGMPREDEGGATMELLVAREVRLRLFELRDAVLELEGELRETPPAQWAETLARIERVVASFIFGPAFPWMRASDKPAFIAHRRNLEEITSLWSPLRAAPAARVVDALARHLEAMQVINQRECLLNHDRRALERVVESLRAARDADLATSRRGVAAAVAALAEAQGRDEELDSLLAQTLDPNAVAPMDAILVRAEWVLSNL